MIALSFLSLSSSFAEPKPLGEKGGTPELGTELHYFKYEEPDVMEEDGVMFGFFGGYTYRIQKNAAITSMSDIFKTSTLNTYTLEGKFSFGQVDYSSNGTGAVDNIDDFLTEVRGLAGYDLPVGEGRLLTPYIGLGYRYWNDQLGGKTSTTGHSGYDRESQYFYLPLGLAFGSSLQDGWGLRANVEYDFFLDGTQKSHLEDVSSSLNTLENDQNDGFGVRGSVTLTKDSGNIRLLVEPFVRYWEVDNSSVAAVTCGGVTCAYGYEPKNKTIETGVKVGAQF